MKGDGTPRKPGRTCADRRAEREALPPARSVLLRLGGWTSRFFVGKQMLTGLPSFLRWFFGKIPEPRQKKCSANSGMMGPFLSERARVLLGISPSPSSKYFLL